MSILIETLAMAATVAAGAQAVTTGLGDATDRLSTVVGRLATESLDTAGAAAIGRSRRACPWPRQPRSTRSRAA
ncbi:hypothetical protein AvCA_32150 [Azotobacter vinelandii CA]|uniref:Uncharacterized protein n=2 Tax=Azotobacter vinelandii TaxID=354 RepID=C1DP24_AZOVD|nr:hypothetical protein [Azotobacter vinelandii]ACO79377.1 hypothetical protein Avin_32150 [Azotobacter vinelandii DJ]AGK16408.1 hypothetical protein AvCA_32150 [Azotobacter vinelandii CA]AGK21171.1 hypothetical protein AvCA6_32150 [Azotobacter vinelandii CA6]SFY14064.1 hypothetical protein SAMN04244547_04152 [Azotobacter vinelandii]